MDPEIVERRLKRIIENDPAKVAEIMSEVRSNLVKGEIYLNKLSEILHKYDVYEQFQSTLGATR